MAERLPVGAVKNVKSPSLASFGSTEVSCASIDRLNIQATSPEADLTESNNPLLSNGSSTVNNRSTGQNKQSQSDSTNRNGSKTKDSESRSETEWVEQDEPGVYITLTSLPGGVIDLKRVRFRYAMLFRHCFSVNLQNFICEIWYCRIIFLRKRKNGRISYLLC